MVDSFTQAAISEIADNWPAFVYIMLTTGFSVAFLKERRRETRVLKSTAESLQLTFDKRFSRLESLLLSNYSDKREVRADTPKLDGSWLEARK